MDIHIPPSLEDLCFDVAFKELITTMNQSYNQIQEEVSVFSQLKIEELVTFIRGHLDQHLVGKVSREVRYSSYIFIFPFISYHYIVTVGI